MLTEELFTIDIDGHTYTTRLRTWGPLARNYHRHRYSGHYELVPIQHRSDSHAVRVDASGVPVGYLPNPDHQGLKAKVKDALAMNRATIIQMAQDTVEPEQLELLQEEDE